ncbi:hypothetical protein LTR37_000742 [Vermiconidia calcicola]|uniref:Uncharacterized protein n=1 Tax=Vermiconidia calcicola TaxID=1690605 RepID=A0ACC3P0Y5_9PEZI|nr:hypothetical protein LTR37_000742 [Vermiconidia calcicola]
MSSPFRTSDRSPSSQRSTPSRALPNGNKRVNGYHRSHRDSLANDSPSRQLVEDLGRMLINDDRIFQRSLDEQTSAQERLHREALELARAKHEEVCASADRARERVELEIEKERRRREDEEKRAVERARRELEEQKLTEQRRQVEEQRAREEERKKQESLKREQDDAKRRLETQKQQEEQQKAQRERQEKEEAGHKARQESEARERLAQTERERQKAVQQPQAPAPQVNGNGTAASRPTPSAAPSAPQQAPSAAANIPQGLVSSVEDRESVHRKYLDLHKRLKHMREHVIEECKKVPGLKDQVSEWRRTIQKCCGQISKGATDEVKANNKKVTLQIVAQLDAAANVANPLIDITQYLVQNQQPPGANSQGPAALLFLLNHFAKNIIGQFISESSVDPKSADPIGLLATIIFARPQYLFNGQSLIDILWAKYHKHCPVLFGISGSERTKEGRSKLGWGIDLGSNSYVRDQEHYDRMSGLGAGFAAITLRDFSKSQNRNPAPNRTYWESLARIVNTPAQDVQPTHFIVLKAMVNNSVPRIISTFGGAGVAMLRQALIYFPNEKGPQDERGRKLPAVTAVQAMPMVLQRDLHLTL